MIWVQEAQKDHYDFVMKMKARDIEVLELHDLLATVLESSDARAFVLDRRITHNVVGIGTAELMRPWLDEMPAAKLAEHLIGGFAISDLPDVDVRKRLIEAFGEPEFVLPPIPNTHLPARSVVLDLRRGDLQSHVLAGAQARDAATARRLQVPPHVPRSRLQGLVGRLRRGLHRSVARGR